MFKIAVCDDVRPVCHQIEGILLDYAKAEKIPMDVEVFYDGESLYEFIKSEHGFDLIYLDIEMNALSGLDLGRELRQTMDDIDTEIVFVSGTSEYDRKLFDVQPLHFIPKPIEAKQVLDDLCLAMKKHGQGDSYFVFNMEKDMVRLRYSEILYFESTGRKIRIVCEGCEYSYYDTLQHLSEVLPSWFCRVHKSYIVSLRKVTALHGSYVLMTNQSRLPIGSTYSAEFRVVLQQSLFLEE